jgi:hypothetical protein
MHRPTNPMTLICPRCGAKPGKVCIVFEGEMEVVHVERIEAAAARSHSGQPRNNSHLERRLAATD